MNRRIFAVPLLAIFCWPAIVASLATDGSSCSAYLAPPEGDRTGQYPPPGFGDASGQYLPPAAGDTSGQYLPGPGTRGSSGERPASEPSTRSATPTSRTGVAEKPSLDRASECTASQSGGIAAIGRPVETQGSGDLAITKPPPSDLSVAVARSTTTSTPPTVAQDASIATPAVRGTMQAASPPARLQPAKYQLPVGPARISSGYFDPNYPPAFNRQHLGVDMLSTVGSPVYAPVSGRVVTNMTSAADVGQAYLVIRGTDGVEHVLGHIASNLSVGASVRAGQQVGTVRSWPGEPGRSHVHWGINRLGVAQAMTGDWGWGRALVTATQAQAAARGWVRP